MKATGHITFTFNHLLDTSGVLKIILFKKEFKLNTIIRITFKNNINYEVIAKRLILQRWKLDTVPTFNMWLGELVNIVHREIMIYQ